MALRIEQDYEYAGDDYWKWWVWLEGSDAELDAVADVTYTLHKTFANPVRVVGDRKKKFELRTSGWGTFRIFADVRFRNGQHKHMHHDLELYYPDDTVAPA